MLKSALLVCATSLILSSCTSFDWEAKPWVGDSKSSLLINYLGETIRCDQPAFDTMTCFDPDNIAELRTAIEKIENRKVRNKIKKKFNKAFKRN